MPLSVHVCACGTIRHRAILFHPKTGSSLPSPWQSRASVQLAHFCNRSSVSKAVKKNASAAVLACWWFQWARQSVAFFRPLIVATSSCESRGFLWSLREGRESRGGREGDSKHPPSPSGPAQRPTGPAARSALKTKAWTFIYNLNPPTTLLMFPRPCGPAPIRGLCACGCSFFYQICRNLKPEGAVRGLEPRQGRGRRPGGSSMGGGRV